MEGQRKASVWTRGIVTAALAAGLVLPAMSQATLIAAAGVCEVAASSGTIVGYSCVHGDDPGQGAPGSIPGGSGLGSGVVSGGSNAGVLQDYGVFHGFATAAGGGIAATTSSGGINASARGIMIDTWTIQGGTGFGYLTLEWTVSGSTTLDGYRGATANLQMDVQTYAPRSQQGDGHLFITQGGIYSIQRLPFFFDLPLNLVVSSNVVASSGYDEGGGPYAFFAAAQFGHTSTLTGITAYDASGRPIDGITITAASGAHYPVMVDATPPGDPGGPPQSVPEPASGALVAMGLFAAGWTRRRRGAERA